MSILTVPTLGARQPAALPPELALDTLLAERYRIGPVLAHRAAGLDYAARDERLDQRVTVLVVDGAAPGVAEAARLRSRVTHPGLARVLGVVEEPGRTCVVRERLDGPTLAEEMRTRRATFTQAEAGDVVAAVVGACRVAVESGFGRVVPDAEQVVRTTDGRTVVDLALDPTDPAAGHDPEATGAGIAALTHLLLTGKAAQPAAPPAWRVNPTVGRTASDALARALEEPSPAALDALLVALGQTVDPTTAWRPAMVDLRDDPTATVPEVPAPLLAPAPVVVPAPVAAPAPIAGQAPVVAPAPVVAVEGAVPAGRPWVTVPLGLAGVALASAAPVVLTVGLGLVVAPALATWGDVVSRGRSPLLAPWWALRNLALAAVRAIVPALVLLVGLLLWWGTGAFDGMDTAGRVLLRLTGAVAGWVSVSSISRGGRGFRSHLALDDLARRLVPAGRPTIRVVPLLVVCAGLVLAGLSFTPEAWPVGG